MSRRDAHHGDLSRIKNELQGQINGKLTEAELADGRGDTSDAANSRRIAAEWQKVVNGTT